jgi:DMSO/TMAO reductase YedYZ molybdopterin-dependent catalytic subunit
MIVPGRREFLQKSIAAALAGLAARSARRQGTDPFAGGVLLGTRPLFGVGAPVHPLATMIGTGLDARLLADLSTLSSETLVIPNDRFYIRTAHPDALGSSRRWMLHIGGLVRQPVALSLEDIAREVRDMGTHVLECAGNNNPSHFGLMSAAEWTGIPIAAVLDRARPARGAVRVLISGFDRHPSPSSTSTPGASWIFSVEDLNRANAFLATGMNGAPLPKDHGAPMRLVVPRWYGCACIKWVDEIAFVADDVPATSQMMEFAERTFQDGRPERARDYAPAVMDHAAFPVRVEKWVVGGRLLYRIVGILWGGERPTNALAIRVKADEPYRRVDFCPLPSSTSTWSLWWHAWRPPSRGRYDFALTIQDPTIRTRRLDIYYYARSVEIEEV